MQCLNFVDKSRRPPVQTIVTGVEEGVVVMAGVMEGLKVVAGVHP